MKYISILRGINVSGHKIIKMSDLKVLYEKLGFENVTTYIQSGNLIFESKLTSENEIIIKIEKAISDSYNYEVPVLVKNMNDMENIINNNPFSNQTNIDVKKLHVTFLSDNTENELIEKIKDYKSGNDKFIIDEKVIYLYCPDGYGNTKLNNTFFEKKLQIKATTRNWQTVNKLFEIANMQL